MYFPVLTGPTAVGKTEITFSLAKNQLTFLHSKNGIEIINLSNTSNMLDLLDSLFVELNIFPIRVTIS